MFFIKLYVGFANTVTMDTTEVLLVICISLTTVNLVVVSLLCCIVQRYIRQATRDSKFKPSYNLETSYTKCKVALDNHAFAEEKTIEVRVETVQDQEMEHTNDEWKK